MERRRTLATGRGDGGRSIPIAVLRGGTALHGCPASPCLPGEMVPGRATPHMDCEELAYSPGSGGQTVAGSGCCIQQETRRRGSMHDVARQRMRDCGCFVKSAVLACWRAACRASGCCRARYGGCGPSPRSEPPRDARAGAVLQAAFIAGSGLIGRASSCPLLPSFRTDSGGKAYQRPERRRCPPIRAIRWGSPSIRKATMPS